MIVETCKAAGGFWFTDDQTIAMFAGYIFIFFLGLHIGRGKQ